MKLYIDTSNRDKIIVGLDGKMYESAARQDASQKLLPFIDEVLKNLPAQAGNKTLKDITEIKVNTGPGSFTGLRVGVAVANALGWALGVPVNGKNLDRGESVDIRYDDSN